MTWSCKVINSLPVAGPIFDSEILGGYFESMDGGWGLRPGEVNIGVSLIVTVS